MRATPVRATREHRILVTSDSAPASVQVANSFRFLLPVLVANLVQLVTLPVLTRLVSPEDFGAWALAMSYALVVGGLGMVGLHAIYERNFFQYGSSHGRSELLYSVVLFSAAGLGVAGLVTWVWRASITEWLVGDARYQNLLVLAFAGSSATYLLSYFLIFLRSDEQAGAFATYTIADRVLTGSFQVGLVAWAGAGAVGIVVGQLLGTASVLVLVVLKFRRRVPWALAWSPLADSLRLSLPMLPRLVLATVGSNVDKYLIGRVASLGGAGIYAVGQRVATLSFTYLQALASVYKPRVYQLMFAGGDDAAVQIGRYLTPFAYISTSCALLIAVFSEEALRVLAPGSFSAAVTVVTILSLHYGLQFFGTMPQISYSRKTYLISVLAAVATVVTVAFGAAGIWMFGTVGAAWGTLAAGIVNLSISFVVGQRCYRIDWESRKMAAILGLLVFCALATVILRAVGTPYPLLLTAKLALVGAFLWLGRRLGIVTSANIAMVGRVVAPLFGAVRRPPRAAA